MFNLYLFLFVSMLGLAGASLSCMGLPSSDVVENIIESNVTENNNEDELRDAYVPMVLKCKVGKDGKVCRVQEVLPLDVNLTKELNGPLSLHDQNGAVCSRAMQGLCMMKDGSKKLLHGLFIVGHQGVVWFIPHGVKFLKNAYNLTTSTALACVKYVGNRVPAALTFDTDLSNLFGFGETSEETDEAMAIRLQREEIELMETLETEIE